jgi:hypothetical protein
VPLVRRSTLTSAPGQTGYVASGVAAVPRQPGEAPAGPGAPFGPGQEQAAATPALPASIGAILTSLLVVAIAGGVAWMLPKATTFHVGTATAAYGVVFVFAAAVERLLEPLSHWLPGRGARNAYDATVAAMMNGHPAADLTAVARSKAAFDRSVANRAIVLWGVATAVATVVSAASGVYLLHMVASDSWNPAAIPGWIDAIVTGLVVGSGTKPLHDVITKVQTTRGTEGGA